ncbi:unnamed protein product [Ceratitis capitata]|uniref:(Mediterranean fruit fly) hypothetical protein n=1 Tax=Ceratitis capitata TaxID=7213 RepID=A0A811UX62_CERCA|nr:unnamed protein product [Ceratitis capitata]
MYQHFDGTLLVKTATLIAEATHFAKLHAHINSSSDHNNSDNNSFEVKMPKPHF